MTEQKVDLVEILFDRIDGQVKEIAWTQRYENDTDLLLDQFLLKTIQAHAAKLELNLADVSQVAEKLESTDANNQEIHANIDLLYTIEEGFDPIQIDPVTGGHIAGGLVALSQFVRNKKEEQFLRRTIAAITLYGTVNKLARDRFLPMVNDFLYRLAIRKYLKEVKESYSNYLTVAYQTSLSAGDKEPLIKKH